MSIGEAVPVGAAPCLPYAEASAALRARLIARAEALGHVRTTVPDPWIETAGGRVLPERTGGTYRFRLPEGCGEARLASGIRRPCDVDPHCNDRRTLGLALRRLVLHDADATHEIALDDAWLENGFHPIEHDEKGALRWTGGSATLPLAAYVPSGDAVVLDITVEHGLPYWQMACGTAVRQAA